MLRVYLEEWETGKEEEILGFSDIEFESGEENGKLQTVIFVYKYVHAETQP